MAWKFMQDFLRNYHGNRGFYVILEAKVKDMFFRSFRTLMCVCSKNQSEKNRDDEDEVYS